MRTELLLCFLDRQVDFTAPAKRFENHHHPFHPISPHNKNDAMT
jgi:hypothetical protein